MEAQAGFEPAHDGFADRRVTTSPLRHNSLSPAAAHPSARLRDPKRSLRVPHAPGPRIPIPTLSRAEAQPKALRQPCGYSRTQPSEPVPDNPNCEQPEPPVHEFLEQLSGSLPPTVSVKATAPKWFANGQGRNHSSRERSKMFLFPWRSQKICNMGIRRGAESGSPRHVTYERRWRKRWWVERYSQHPPKDVRCLT
jgi:hypothetical protein